MAWSDDAARQPCRVAHMPKGKLVQYVCTSKAEIEGWFENRNTTTRMIKDKTRQSAPLQPYFILLVLPPSSGFPHPSPTLESFRFFLCCSITHHAVAKGENQEGETPSPRP